MRVQQDLQIGREIMQLLKQLHELLHLIYRNRGARCRMTWALFLTLPGSLPGWT